MLTTDTSERTKKIEALGGDNYRGYASWGFFTFGDRNSVEIDSENFKFVYEIEHQEEDQIIFIKEEQSYSLIIHLFIHSFIHSNNNQRIANFQTLGEELD